MKDRYLFRGKSVDDGEWVYGSLIELDGEVLIEREDLRYYINPDTIGQCTGLKARNGALIHEGDIVENISHQHGIVKWGIDGKCCFEIEYKNTMNIGQENTFTHVLSGNDIVYKTFGTIDTIRADHLTVTGNIYEQEGEK